MKTAMAAMRYSLCNVVLLLCLSRSQVKAFAPVPARLTPVRLLHPPSKLPPTSVTRTCRPSTTRLQLSPSASLSWWYMSLLALQFGCQPILTKKYTPKTITRSTVVLFQEVVKFAAAAIFLLASGDWAVSLTGKMCVSW